MTYEFGWDTYGWAAGVIEAPVDFWGVGAELAVAFVPFDTVPASPIDVRFPLPSSASGSSWDVYYVDKHGEAAGPIGAASISGGDVVISDLEPPLINWLLLVATK
jgi:hypothetical protein